MKNDVIIGLQPAITLADLMARLPLMDISEGRLKNQLAALRTFARVVLKPPEQIHIDPAFVRKLMDEARPIHLNISTRRWSNVKTEVRGAMRLFNILEPHPTANKLPSDWEALIALISHPARRSTFRRFAAFCVDRGVARSDVSAKTIAEYEAYLVNDSVRTSPRRIAGDARRIWNRVAASDETGLPLIEKPIDRDRYSLPWESFPAEFKADVEAYTAARSTQNWDSDDALPVFSEATRAQYRRMFRRLASLAVLSGTDPNDMKSIGDLVRPSRLRLALKFMQARNDGEKSKDMFHMVTLARTAGHRWTDLSPPELRELDTWSKRLRYARDGLTEKNRERLRQFVDSSVHRRMERAPEEVFSRLARAPEVNSRMATLAARALMLAFELVAPIRLKNLAALNIERNFHLAFSTDEKTLVLSLSAAETKNNVDLALPIPAWLVALFEIYKERYHPVLARNAPSPWLFPGRWAGLPMTESGVSKALPAFVKRELGLDVNTHLFRHLAGLVYLKHRPGDYETVRRLLGHKNIQTTTNFYVGLETEEAFARYHETLRARGGISS